MIPALADLPIPAGPDAVAEAGLLAQALMSASPAFAEARFAVRRNAASRTGGNDGFFHVTLRRGGEVIQSYFIEYRTDGSARYHADVSDDVRAHAVEITADVSDMLTARLRALANVVTESADEGYSRPVRNALSAAEATLRSDGTDPALAATARKAMEVLLQGITSGSADQQLDAARSLVYDAATQHLNWELDGCSLAAIMMMVNVPIACAVADAGKAQAVTFTRYLGLAASALRFGEWMATGEVISKALREGYTAALAELNKDLFAEALRLRDEALDGPPSPMAFGRKLFEAVPAAFAAWWIACIAEAYGNAPPPGPGKDTWTKRRTDNEEWYTRLVDGIFAQWLRRQTNALAAEREEVLTALRTKGKLAVDNLLEQGEDSLFRPRSLRSYLLGERDIPDGS